MKNISDLNFEKRSNLYRKYRSEINKESMNLLDPYNSDQRLNKIKKEIDKINPNILKTINNDIELSKGNYVNIDFSSNYKMLQFEINDLDNDKVEMLQTEIQNINDIKKSNFILNNDCEFLNNETTKYKENIDYLNNIKNKIDDVANSIQLFPKHANEDLTVLENSLSIAKNKKDSINENLKVKTNSITKTRDLKKFYFIALILIISFLVIVIILIVLLLVL